MEEPTVVQGRRITATEIEQIRQMLRDNRGWSRRRVSRELCAQWDWRTPLGQPKDMACRTLLLKLERRGLIQLPAPRWTSVNGGRRRPAEPVSIATDPITAELAALLPLEIKVVCPRSEDAVLFDQLLRQYHYLGYRRSVGENFKYLIRDRRTRILGCALFGAAAWKSAPRDDFIGWDAETRARNLGLLANNMRFLILPWVEVPHLASHLLSRLSHCVRKDWPVKYGHPIHMLETFVDAGRFRGTCYKAANWICVGQTQGRSRNDRERTLRVPVKDIYLYPLSRNFRRELCDVDT